jgi:signal transduction histidine kinase
MNNAHCPMRGLREVCHDIRQPIAGVLAVAEAALAEADLPEHTRSRLEQIVELAEWQSDVLENWLEALEGSGSPGVGCTDVVRIVNDAAGAERQTWPGDLTLLWPPEPVATPVHPIVLRRMAANLLANATGAAGPAGAVTIEVSRQDTRILLAVEDDGPGFGRLPRGYGLGLSYVARAAAQHRGSLECGRGKLGGGRVSLWLPSAVSMKGQVADAACHL